MVAFLGFNLQICPAHPKVVDKACFLDGDSQDMLRLS